MAPKKGKSSKLPKKSKPVEAPEAEPQAPEEGTQGVIWGQQVKKLKSTGWVESLDWRDAAPTNYDEFLMGAEEGGFMGLEEIDGEVFDEFASSSKPGTGNETKKRKAPADDAGGGKAPLEKAPKKKKGSKVDAMGGGMKDGLEGGLGAEISAGGENSEVGLVNQAVKGKEKKGVMAKKGEDAKTGGETVPNGGANKGGLETAKVRKMTSSEIKKRKKEKRRERKFAGKEKLELEGLFKGVESNDKEVKEPLSDLFFGGEVKATERGEEEFREGDLDGVTAGRPEVDEAATAGEPEVTVGEPVEKRLSKKERLRLRAKENNERRAAAKGEQVGEGDKMDIESKGGVAETSETADEQRESPVAAQGVKTDKMQGRLGAVKAVKSNKKRKKLEKETSDEVEDPDLEGGDGEDESEPMIRGGEAGPTECDVSAWEEFGLHPLLLKGLAKLGFSQPTEIQKQCIPAALQQGKDLVGAAETGSGKTLAFGLPILHRLMQIQEKEKKRAEAGRVPFGDTSAKKGGGALRALIMTPTRELALQVCAHLKAVAQETSIRIVPIVGGMAVPKQQRLLKSRPEIVVGTPGRLWELISQGEQHLLQVDDLRFFVLDEADRMVEKGHFKELQSIIDTLPKQGGAPPAESDPPEEDAEPEPPKTKHAAQRQTFVFSATLMVPPSLKTKLKGAGKVPLRREQGQVAALIERAGLSRRAAIVDLTSDSIVAAKLEEAAIECLDTEKDAYLYYLLKLHPSRTIVFCTAISAVRRIAALLRLLQVPSWPLHAQMQQRQRFKAMDRFKKEDHGVLVATDVAARGLDIEGIRCVIHYQLPLSTEIYVHRSGRTARAATDGISVAIISPSERPKLNALCKALGKEEGLAPFPVNQAYMPAVLERVKLAVKVDSALRQQQQTKAKRSWLEKNANELDIELDADELEDQSRTSKKGKIRVDVDKAPSPGDAKVLEAKLRTLVKQPLQPRAMHHTYLAGSGISAETVKQLQQAVRRKEGVGTGAIGTQGEEALVALRSKRAKR